MRNSAKIFSMVLAAGMTILPGVAREKGSQDEIKKLQAAEQALRQSVTAPDKGIPKDLLQKAECIGVFPDVKKAAFVVGGEGGRGVFTCRAKDGKMSAPAFFTIGGPSIGFQAGIQEADVILLVMNDEGVQKLLQDHVTLGGEASAAAGPVGRTAQAGTDAQMHAQILSWSRSRGLFAGVSLEGMVLKQNNSATEDFYGKAIEAKEILVNQSVPVPPAAQSFVKTTTQVAKRSS